MVPPNKHLRMLWDVWLDGNTHKVEYDTYAEATSFCNLLCQRARHQALWVVYSIDAGDVELRTFLTRSDRCEYLKCVVESNHWWD